jgi:glutathione peroxidase
MHFYDIEVVDDRGDIRSLKEYQGKVILIVNTATDCGYATQYDELEDLYQEYKDKGFMILDFPCNQEGEHAPKILEETLSFCADTGVSFPQFEMVDVNGDKESLLYTYLKDKQEEKLSKRIEWNFTKFLVDKKGNVLHRFEPLVTPKEIIPYIEKILDI